MVMDISYPIDALHILLPDQPIARRLTDAHKTATIHWFSSKWCGLPFKAVLASLSENTTSSAAPTSEVVTCNDRRSLPHVSSSPAQTYCPGGHPLTDPHLPPSSKASSLYDVVTFSPAAIIQLTSRHCFDAGHWDDFRTNANNNLNTPCPCSDIERRQHCYTIHHVLKYVPVLSSRLAGQGDEVYLLGFKCAAFPVVFTKSLYYLVRKF